MASEKQTKENRLAYDAPASRPPNAIQLNPQPEAPGPHPALVPNHPLAPYLNPAGGLPADGLLGVKNDPRNEQFMANPAAQQQLQHPEFQQQLENDPRIQQQFADPRMQQRLQLLGHRPVFLPPRERKIGAATVLWWDGKPGDAVIMAHGGSCDDRSLAEQITKMELEALGSKRAMFLIEHDQMKTADAGSGTAEYSQGTSSERGWPAIMNKAKRLIQSGQVTLLRNGYNNVVGHVIGDHGEYNVEIGRDDPDSRAITTWTCECPWDQYAWQRTRKWKKYEGRPCSHVMALYWKAKMTPLDEDYDPSQGGIEPGQKPAPLPEGHPLKDMEGEAPPAPPEGTPDATAGPPTAGPVPPPPQAPLAPPGASGVLPPSPMEQMQMMQPPMPGQTPNGMPAPPGTVSVPGARFPTPFNPITYPGGTYSKTAAIDYNPDHRVHKGTMDGAGNIHCWPVDNAGAPHHDEGISDAEWQSGPLIVPEEENGHIHDFAIENGTVYERYPGEMPEDTKYRIIRSIPDVRFERTRRTAADAPFVNGDIIRTKNPVWATKEGREGATDAGEYIEIPPGTNGEVLGMDQTTGWVDVIFPLDGGAMTSYHARCWAEPTDIVKSQMRPPGPFIKRRR